VGGGTGNFEVVGYFVTGAGGILVHIPLYPFPGVLQAQFGEGVFDLPGHKPLETFLLLVPNFVGPRPRFSLSNGLQAEVQRETLIGQGPTVAG
jgi:hypothetical protein